MCIRDRPKVYCRDAGGIDKPTESIMNQPNFSYWMVLSVGPMAENLKVGDIFLASRYATAHKFWYHHEDLGGIELMLMNEENADVIATDHERIPAIKNWAGDSTYELHRDKVVHYE